MATPTPTPTPTPNTEDLALDELDIHDPDRYVEGPPHEAFRRLRRDDPVHWQPVPDTDGGGYWAILRHADLVEVARDPQRFSAAEGGVVLEDLDADSLAMMRDMILAMDPPRHLEYRRALSPSFKATVMAGLEPRIRAIIREIFDREAPAGTTTLDFVHDICSHVPSQIVGELVGIPLEDRPHIHMLCERNPGGQDPELGGYSEEGMTASIELAVYAMALAARRREDPQEDLTTLMVNTEVDGELMTDLGFGRLFVQLVVAGNDTSRTMLSSGLLALLQHPEQLQELRDDPSLIPGAVEEILRWANPLHYFRRTALEDVTVGSTQIEAGQKVAMIYTSANRDEAVFADPDRFDIHRDPNPHLSFGIAEHFCLGVHLARVEGRVFFEELLRTYPTIELAGEPRRQRSNLNNALKALPVRLTR